MRVPENPTPLIKEYTLNNRGLNIMIPLNPIDPIKEPYRSRIDPFKEP